MFEFFRSRVRRRFGLIAGILNRPHRTRDGDRDRDRAWPNVRSCGTRAIIFLEKSFLISNVQIPGVTGTVQFALLNTVRSTLIPPFYSSINRKPLLPR